MLRGHPSAAGRLHCVVKLRLLIYNRNGIHCRDRVIMRHDHGHINAHPYPTPTPPLSRPLHHTILVRHNTIQYNTRQYNTIQYNIIHSTLHNATQLHYREQGQKCSPHSLLSGKTLPQFHHGCLLCWQSRQDESGPCG